MESFEIHGTTANPRDAAERPPPLPDREEVRATKKVRHREADSPSTMDYRSSLMAGSERPVTMGELSHDKSVHVAPGDVAIDSTTPIPAITLSTGLKERLASNMKFSVVVNLLGRTIGYTILCAKLRHLWDLRGAKIVDMGGGFFLVQFATEEAYQEAVLEGPWTLLGSYLQVQSWTTAFRIHHAAPLSTVVWIRITELPLHLYPLTVISAIGEAVGKVIRVDSNTSGMQRGKFARLAVEINLTKPLVSKFTIDGEEFKVEYENLQDLCFHCGMYGHRCDSCVHRPKEHDEGGQGENSTRMEVASAEVYGPWMVVERKRKQNGKSREAYGRGRNDDGLAGSRFDVLREEKDEDSLDTERLPTMENYTPAASREGSHGGNGKGTQSRADVSVNSSSQGHRSRNSRPANTTFGELFEYQNKARREEKIVPSTSSLDKRSHSVFRVEKELKIRGEREGILRHTGEGPDAMVIEPTADRREVQMLGRPPDDDRVGTVERLEGEDNDDQGLEGISSHLLCENNKEMDTA